MKNHCQDLMIKNHLLLIINLFKNKINLSEIPIVLMMKIKAVLNISTAFEDFY